MPKQKLLIENDLDPNLVIKKLDIVPKSIVETEINKKKVMCDKHPGELKKLLYKSILDDLENKIELVHAMKLKKDDLKYYEGRKDVRPTLQKYQKEKMNQIFEKQVSSKIYYVEVQADLQEQIGRQKLAISEAKQIKSNKDKKLEEDTKKFSKTWRWWGGSKKDSVKK